MELFLEFIVQNYIWILIIGIVVVMTIIGYIADKTDFGKESMKRNKEKKQTVTDEFDNDDEPNVTEAFQTDELDEVKPSKKELRRMKKEEAKKQKEELKRQREEEKRQRNEEIEKQREQENQSKEENLNNQENDINEKIPTYNQEELNNDVKEEVAEEPKNDIFNEPFSFDETTDAVEIPIQEEQKNKFEEPEVYEHKEEKPELKEEPKKENSELIEDSKEEPKNDLEEIPEIELPSIESLDEELKDDEDDDVWKF